MQGPLTINNIVFFKTLSFRTQPYSITTLTKSFKSFIHFPLLRLLDQLEKGHFEKKFKSRFITSNSWIYGTKTT